MSEARYDVVVSGSALDGFDIEQVKEEFAKLFSLAEHRTEQIFSKGDVVIKRNVAEPTANKFVTALERIGAAAHLLPIQEEPESKPESTQPPIALESTDRSAFTATTPTPSPAPVSETDEMPPTVGHVFKKEKKKAKTEQAIEAPTLVETETDSSQTDNQTDAQSDTLGDPNPFSFHGNGYEYFRIWIVNILLTIATLGIYSAWAKVRNAQYFYGNTEVAGSRFGYHAKPLTILKGRIIAVLVFVIYTAVQNFFPIAGLAMTLLLVAILPWIVIRSLRFSRRMSSWRNIRFGFDGTLWPAVSVFILWPLLGAISFGLLMPLAMYKQNEFIINNTRYGTTSFTLNSCLKDFYIIFLVTVLLMILAGVLGAFIGPMFPPAAVMVAMVVYLYLFVYVSVRTNNLLFNNSDVGNGNFTFKSTWTDGSFFKLMLVNSLCSLFTLGLFYPWAKVRTARYKAERLTLLANADLDGFVAGEEEHVNALGEEMGDIFDVDFGI